MDLKVKLAKTVMELQGLVERFVQLSPHDLEALAGIARRRLLKPDELYLSVGERSQNSAFVLSGVLKTVWFDLDGSDRTIELLVRDNFVTNFESYMKKEPSSVEIRALVPTELLYFNNDALMGLCKVSAGLMELSSVLSQQIVARKTEHTHIISLKKPIDRYRYITANKPYLLQQVNLTELAKYLYITRETLSRCRAMH